MSGLFVITALSVYHGPFLGGDCARRNRRTNCKDTDRALTGFNKNTGNWVSDFFNRGEPVRVLLRG
jgi:hypothetical protein